MNNWIQQPIHKPFAEWLTYDFAPDTFSCGHDKTVANMVKYESKGYAGYRCLTCKRENEAKYRGK